MCTKHCVVLCGWGGVVCVNCIVDACDFFFVHVLVFLAPDCLCVLFFRHTVDAWAWQADEGRGGLR